jgi:uncharacterized protein (UPF0335 family)
MVKKAAHGEIGHNSGDTLTDEQEAHLFFNHKKKIAGLKSKLATVTADLRNAYKEAKSEGFPKKDFDYAFLLEKDEDDKAIQQRRREARIALWLNHPIGTQSDLFADGSAADQRSQHEKGAAEGKRAGLAGETCKPPYDAGTDGYDGYMKAYYEAQAVVAAQVKKKEAADAPLIVAEGRDESGVDELDKAADSAGAGSEAPWPDDIAIAEREEAEAL